MRFLGFLVFLFCLFVQCSSPKSHGDAGVIDFYYRDTLDLCAHFGGSGYKIRTADYDNIEIRNDKLYIKDLGNLNVTRIELCCENRVTELTLKLKIRCWENEVFSFEDMHEANNEKMVLSTLNDTTYFIEDNQLFFAVGNMQNRQFCSKFLLTDKMYCQMVRDFGITVIRISGNIFVSRDLKRWVQIYEGLRGIKESMVLIKNESGDVNLLFSQYTTGAERKRHHILRYDFKTGLTTVMKTFYTHKEFLEEGLAPCARHIHTFVKDPYSGYLFVGTGDNDTESSIYFSKDNGKTFLRLGGGSQQWRTLSFVFSEEHIFWNTDSPDVQYLTRLRRSDLGAGISEQNLTRFPLINSALWCTISTKLEDGTPFIVMTSNSEGALYDNKNRVYGIQVKNGEPHVYELFSVTSRTDYSQMFPVGVDNEGYLYFFEHELGKIMKFKLRRDGK